MLKICISLLIATAPFFASAQTLLNEKNGDSSLPRPNGGPSIGKLIQTPKNFNEIKVIPEAKKEYKQELCPTGFFGKDKSAYFTTAMRTVVIYKLNGQEVGSNASPWDDVEEDCTKIEELNVACPIGYSGSKLQKRKVATKNNGQFDYGSWEIVQDTCKKNEEPKNPVGAVCLYDSKNYIYWEERDYLGSQYEELWTMQEVKYVFDGKIILQEIEKNKLPRPVKIGDATYSPGKNRLDKEENIKGSVPYIKHYGEDEICVNPPPIKPDPQPQWVKTDYVYGFFVEFDGTANYFGSTFWYGKQFVGKASQVYSAFYWVPHGLKNGWTHNYNYASVNSGINMNVNSAYANKVKSSLPGTILKDSSGREFRIGAYIGYENAMVDFDGYTLFFNIEEKKK